MKIVVFGCQQIAVDFIKYLLQLPDVELCLIVTYELPLDVTYGYESVIDNFINSGLDIRNPASISSDLIKEIEDLNPDIIFSLYYRKIFPQKLLSIPRLGCVNVHPSLLPEYRGPTPTAWSILNNEAEVGVTIHLMDDGIDTGDILVQQKTEVDGDETGYELYTRTMKIGAELLIEHFYNIIYQRVKPYKQVKGGSYFGKINGRYFIDWKQRAIQIKNLVRVHARPYNPAETILLNRHVFVNSIEIVRNSEYVVQKPGKIVHVLKDETLVVSCADGCLLLTEYKIFPELNAVEKAIYLKEGNYLC